MVQWGQALLSQFSSYSPPTFQPLNTPLGIAVRTGGFFIDHFVDSELQPITIPISMATEAREPPTTACTRNERTKIYCPGLANTGKRRTGETERAMRKTMRCTKELGNKLACKKER